MSSTIDQIREAERHLSRLREQAKVEEAEKERARIEEERKALLAQKQREANQKEERKKALPAEIKKADAEVKKAEQALSSAQYESRRLRIELDNILNPKPPPPPKEQKDYSKCRCTGGDSFYNQDVQKCDYCYDYGR
jgi:seryl-tRNA synthetase